MHRDSSNEDLFLNNLTNTADLLPYGRIVRNVIIHPAGGQCLLVVDDGVFALTQLAPPFFYHHLLKSHTLCLDTTTSSRVNHITKVSSSLYYLSHACPFLGPGLNSRAYSGPTH